MADPILTWFYFGSLHPCFILVRLIEWDSGEYQDEKWHKDARGLAIINVLHMDLQQAEKNRLKEKLESAPAEVIRQCLTSDTTPEATRQRVIDSVNADTPANCTADLFVRFKNQIFGPDSGQS